MSWLLAGIGAVLGASCGPGPGAREEIRQGVTSARPRIVVTIPPLEWAVRGLMGDAAEIRLIVPPGAPAHGYELTPSQAASVAGADVVVMVGLDMEPRVEAAMTAHPNDQRRVVRFADVVAGDAVEGDGHHHTHDGPDHAHDHAQSGGTDPHAWLDPVLMGRFVALLAREFQAAPEDPAAGRAMAQRAAELQNQCASIDRAYHAALSRAATHTIVAHHNAYSYLARRYGLNVAAVIRGEGAGDAHGGEATPGAIADAVSALRESGARAVFVEPQLNDALARRIADAAGVRVLTLDPLGDGDWPELMRANLLALIDGLGVEEAGAGGAGG